jgi:uncharacterized protein (TIGR03435 family)
MSVYALVVGNGGPTLKNSDETVAATLAGPNGSAASVFTALRALGLKLESRKAPIAHFVIDHVEKIPSEN